MSHPQRQRPLKRLGQHFLTDPGLMEEMLDRAGISASDRVVELGAGKGILTIPLARRVERMVAVEVDPFLIPVLKKQLKIFPEGRVRLSQGDIMKLDYKALSEELGGKLTVVGNIPYQLTSPILFQLLDAKACLARALLTMQKEVGVRLLGAPCTKAYGILTVLVSYVAAARPVMEIPASAFHPRPKVDSLSVLLDFSRPHPRRARDENIFKKLVRAAFAHRRKTLKNALKSFLETDPSPMLESLGINPERRPETLNMDEWIKISNSL